MEATEHLKTAANAARAATHVLARSSETTRNTALAAMADALRDGMRDILAANRQDVGAYRGTAAILDRLTLTEARIEAMARGLEEVAALPDPLQRTLADWTRPNGLRIQRIADPNRRDRHDLREPAERRRGRLRTLPEVGQRGDPAGRIRQRTQRPGDQRGTPAWAGGRGPAGGLHPSGPQHRPSVCRRHVGRRRAARSDHSARRQVPGGTGAARGTGSRSGACRRPEPHLYPRRRRSGDGAAHPGERQDAADRDLRRDRDAADRSGHRARAAAAARRAT